MTLIEIESYKLVVTNSFASEIESQRLVTPADLIALDSSENERRERARRRWQNEREKWKKAFFFLGLLPLPVLCFPYRWPSSPREGCCTYGDIIKARQTPSSVYAFSIMD